MARKRKPDPALANFPGPGAPGNDKIRSPAFDCVLLALATLLAFGAVGFNDFVNYDDPDYVTANAHVQTGLTLANITWAFTTGHASNWHPLTWLSHMLDCQLFGIRPGPQHLVNLAFHIANTLLLFLVLRRLTGAHWRSAIVAALFAFHPLHVESVAWISERKDVLSTFFFLLALAAYVRYAESVSGAERRVWSGRWRSPLAYAFSLLLFALGLMSKPMPVTLPFLLLLLDYWPLGRLSFSVSADNSAHASCTTHQGQRPPSPLPHLVLEKLPFFALSLTSCVVTLIVQQKGGAVSTSLSLGGRMANALVSYVRYLAKTFCPTDLSVLYPHPGHWPGWQVAASAFVVLAVSAAVVWQARVRPWLAVGWFWFLGSLVPVIGLVQVGIQSMADRYTYIPLIGLFIALVWGVGEVLSAWPRRAEVLPAAVALTLVACALLTVRQVGFWHDSETLFQRAVRVTTNNYLAYNNLAYFLSGRGKPLDAMTNYLKSLEINPLYDDALNNMGYALAGLRRFPEAISYYERALRIRPNHAEVHNNLGNALSEMGRLNEAIEQYSLVLKQNPEHADAHNNLGIALAMQGKLNEAIPHFRDAIRFKPGYASAHSNLGNALAAQHKLDEAIEEYRISLDLNPKDPQAHNNLGNVLAEHGRLDEAIPHYAKAIELNPNNPEAHFNLGMALARQGKRDLATAHYTEALRLKPDYTEARRQLDAVPR
ncbi:MAG TPA: tetratricopeptide repeat protein [Candidatus Acidoferrum sp.]|jgi:tetratricopeptide (TPR) repeat protein|nr:tetratricopeptide repeat protein [Candidatus Acidoferrum sp.]